MTRADSERKRRSHLGAAIAIIAIAGALGAVLGASSPPVDHRQPRADVAAAGAGFVVRYPTDWHRIRAAPRIPGLPSLGEGSVYLSADHNGAGFFATRRPGDLSRAIPAQLAARLGSPTVEKSRTWLRTGAQAYRWTAAHVNGTLVELFAVPVSGATIVAGCAARHGARQEQCRQIIAALETPDSPSVELQPDRSFAAALRQAVGRAAAAERHGTRRLSEAHTARGQANAAMAVSRTLRTASGTLAATEPNEPAIGWQRRAATALTSVGRGFAALAEGFRTGDHAATASARARIRAGQREFAGALAALSAVGFGAAQDVSAADQP
jgi:hypothetical protein